MDYRLLCIAERVAFIVCRVSCDVKRVADYLHNTEHSGSAVGLSFFGIFLRYYHHVLAAK